jgi:hypothetical protein
MKLEMTSRISTQAFLVTSVLVVLGTGVCWSQNCSQVRLQYDEAKAGLQRDARALNSLGFEQTTAGIEEWVKAGEAVHDKAYEQLISGLIAFGLQGAQSGTKVWGSFTPPQANKYISGLKNFGIDSQPWFDSLQQIAYTSGKPAATRQTKELLELTSHLVDGVEAVPKPQQDAARMDVLAGAISFGGGFLVKSPEAGFTLAGWSFLTSLAWSVTGDAIVPARINQLANLSEQQLRALASVDKVIHHHVAAMQNATRQMASRGCSGQSPAAAVVPGKRSVTGCPKIDEGREGRSVWDDIKAKTKANEPRTNELYEESQRCQEAEKECQYHCRGGDIAPCYDGCSNQVQSCIGPIAAESTKIGKEEDDFKAKELCCGTQYVDSYDVQYCQWYFSRYPKP